MTSVTEVCGVSYHRSVNSSPPLCRLRLLSYTAGHQREQSIPHTDPRQPELLSLDRVTSLGCLSCLSQNYSPLIELLPFDSKLYQQARVTLVGKSYFSWILSCVSQLLSLERVTVFWIFYFLSFFQVWFSLVDKLVLNSSC